MPPKEPQKKFKSKVLSLRLLIFVGLILMVFFSISLGKEMYRKYQINKEITAVQEEINSLEQENQEMRDLIEYLNTNSFKEIQARQQLGLQKEGEQAIAIQSAPEEIQNVAGEEEAIEEEQTNTMKWWSYFFGNQE